MKKLLLALFIGLCYISAFGQYNFTLEISSRTLSGKKIHLNIFNNRNYIPIQLDSFLFKSDHLTITGQVSQPSNFASFFVLDKGQSTSTLFVLDSGKNNISLELPDGRSKFLTLKSDARGNHIYEEMNKIPDEIDNYSKPIRTADGRLNMTDELMEEITKRALKGLQTYPTDFGSLLYLYHISRWTARPDNAKEVLATLATFSDNLRNSALGKQLYTEETDLINNKNVSSPGNQVPIFNVRDINNLPFSNSSLKGQNYMIVFSATWCGPCQLELPKLKKLYQAYKKKGLKVIYFNNDDDVARWKKHVTENKLSWINVSERLKPSKSKIQESFGVYDIPTCLIINKEGVIVYNSDKTDPGMDHIESYIKRVIIIDKKFAIE